MQLTEQQQQAVEHGEAVPVQIGNSECVVIRRDVYERIKSVSYDDSEMTDGELHAIAARTLDDIDSAEPIP